MNTHLIISFLRTPLWARQKIYRSFEGILEPRLFTVAFTCQSAKKLLDDPTCRETGIMVRVTAKGVQTAAAFYRAVARVSRDASWEMQ